MSSMAVWLNIVRIYLYIRYMVSHGLVIGRVSINARDWIEIDARAPVANCSSSINIAFLVILYLSHLWTDFNNFSTYRKVLSPGIQLEHARVSFDARYRVPEPNVAVWQNMITKTYCIWYHTD